MFCSILDMSLCNSPPDPVCWLLHSNTSRALQGNAAEEIWQAATFHLVTQHEQFVYISSVDWHAAYG